MFSQADQNYPNKVCENMFTRISGVWENCVRVCMCHPPLHTAVSSTAYCMPQYHAMQEVFGHQMISANDFTNLLVHPDGFYCFCNLKDIL